MNCKKTITAGAACLLMIFLLLPAGSSGQVNPNASEICKKVYSYISSLGGFENRVLAGQNCYHENQIYDYGYEELYEGLYKSTGKYPSLLAVDYEYATTGQA
jgi:hypothetical protein